MTEFPGFEVREVLHRGERSTVLRATRLADGRAVVLKALTLAGPEERDIARFRTAWEVTRGLAAPTICATLDWLPQARLLVLEDIGGNSLAARDSARLPPAEVLAIALQLARALEHLHGAGVIHRDVNPNNVVLAGDRVQLIDFDVATRLPRGLAAAGPPDHLEGTLAYLAPEQTGRMNRPVDRRADLYSLGATLYELLTGSRPFPTDDPIALVHAHLARLPAPPHERAEVPFQLSAIVMRLLAKMPEDRYQSAAGLRADLERLDHALRLGRPAGFALGEQDLPPELEISPRLYGRAREQAALAQAFARARGARPGLVLVRGAPGVGKSALVAELAGNVAREGGSFAAGRHPPGQNAPLVGLVEALRELLREALTRGPAPRVAVALALEGLAPSLAPLLPELGLLLGELAAASPGQAAETQNRVRLGLARLLRALAAPEHPVVLALDDVQRADAATLQILEAVLRDDASSDLLLVCTLREVPADHPAEGLLRAAREAGAPVLELDLAPLGPEALTSLLADSLHGPEEQVRPLALAVHHKTDGNPLFVERFLRSMVAAGSLRFDPAGPRWTWDLDAVRRGEVADNVAELLAATVRALPGPTADVLQAAACFGTRFDVRTVATATGLAPARVIELLGPAVAEGLVAAVGEEGAWRFLHDRLQEAALHLLDGPARTARHLALGRALQAALDGPEREAALFTIVGQLDAGRALLEDPDERHAVARLDLEAGRRAAAATDYAGAIAAFAVGRELVDPARDPALAFVLAHGIGDLAPLAGRPDLAARALEDAAAIAPGPAEAFATEISKLNLLTITGRHADAVDYAMGIVEGLGGPRPRDPAAWGEEMGRQMAAFGERMAGRSPEALLDAPAMTDPVASAEVFVLASVAGASMAIPHVFPVVILRMVNLSLAHGNAIPSPVAYGAWAFILVAMGQPDQGAAFARLALDLAARSPAPTIRPSVEHVTSTYVLHWTRPWLEAREVCASAAEGGLRTGNFTAAGWATLCTLFFAVTHGSPLPELESEALRVAHSTQNDFSYADGATLARAIADTARQLRGSSPGDPAIEAALEHYPSALTIGLSVRLTAATLLGDFDRAILLSDRVTGMLAGMGTPPALADHVFYTAMARIQRDGAAALPALDAALEQVGRWAAACPANQADRHQLLLAERAALHGDPAAGARYDEAAAHAAREGHLAVEALAYERAAALYLAAGRRTIASAYLSEARRAWTRYGAGARVAALEARWPELRSASRGGTVTTASTTTSGGSVEAEVVLRVTRALSAEETLDGLLGALLRLVVQVGGASRGGLVLVQEGQARVQAVGDAEGPRVGLNLDLADNAEIPPEFVQYALTTQQLLVIDDALAVPRWAATPYVRARAPRSVLCAPLVARGTPIGAIYLENDVTAGAFTPAHVELVRVLASQAAMALLNGILVERHRGQAEELRRKNQQLAEVDRLREDLLARTSHELRTPLNGIIGLAEGLLDEAPGEAKASLEMIASSGRRLAHLVDDILDTAALENGRVALRPAAVDLVAVIDDVLALSAPLVRNKPVRLRRNTGALPLAWADRDRVEQVLLNLVGNAARFTEAGEVEVGAVEAEGRIQLTVRDTGPGIAPEDQERIFLPFEQAEAAGARRHGGTGLGLAIARQLVELHGGSLTLRSEPGRGSSFSLSLPVASTAQRAAEAEPRRRAAPVEPALVLPTAATGPRVLVVDDEAVNLQVVVHQLARRGFNPVAARSGPEALALVETGPRPDLVLLDIMMPGMDGYEVCRVLRGRFPANVLPIVMLTARTRAADIAAGFEAGANDYLTKPFSDVELFARIASHLELARVNAAVSRFVPAAFLELLGRPSIADVAAGDAVERDMTVLSARFVGYASLTEGLAADENFLFLNQLLGLMEPALVDHGGFVDKYLGDALLALFARSADDAVAAGVAMHAALEGLNRTRLERGDLPVRLAVGVHSGPLVLGTVGSERRMDTTAVSDVVQIASRVEALSQRYGSGLVITEATRGRLQEPARFAMRPVDRIPVRAAAMGVHDVYEAAPVGARMARAATAGQFARAVQLFHDRQIGEAQRLFQLCQVMDPMDEAVRQYLQRCAAIHQQFMGMD